MQKRHSAGKKAQGERTPIRQILLSLIGAAGIISLAILAPNALRLIPWVQKKYPMNTSRIIRALKLMEEKGLIVFVEDKGNRFARLTKKGERELDRYRFKEKLLTKKKWDRKWRIVAFDIKEFKRSVRAQIRYELQNFGFVYLQKSMWVFPYPCEEVEKLLKAEYRLGAEVLYIEATFIENDRDLRKHFDLPL